MIDKPSVRELLLENTSKLLRDFVNNQLDESYNSIHIGKVINNNDPKKLGRCQIRVYSIYENTIPDSDLPWAIPEFSFIGSDVGSFIVPPNDSLVNVRFSMGNIYEPIYTTKVLNKNKLPTNKNINYPNNMIFFETDNGDYFEINRVTKEIEFKTSTGDIINIDGQGNITIETTNILGGKIDIISKGAVTIKAPSVEIKHDILASVTPNPTGGPFNTLLFDPYTGSIHQGTLVTNQNIL